MIGDHAIREDDNSRRLLRRKVLWNGELTCGGFDFDCKVFDISLRGAQIKLALPLAPGAELTLALEKVGKVPCRVAWQRDGRLGLLFLCDGNFIRRALGAKVIDLGLSEPVEATVH